MKNRICFMLVMMFGLFFSVLGAEEPQPVQKLNLLTIGNSFSDSLRVYLEPVVRSVPGCDVHYDFIHIGGCSLERHWNNIVREEANPDDRHFKEFTYRQKLEECAWDVVTIQQQSGRARLIETYFPFAEQLCGYIRQYAPTAKIMIHQTWAYRSDEPRLTEWGITSDIMFDQVKSAYVEAAKKLNLEIIPMAEAVQLARQTQPGGYEPIDRSKWTYPNLPDMSRYFCGNLQWEDENTLTGDAYHLNNRGKYLQACVWFAVLYHRPASEITFVPDELTPEDAAFLRETAQKAVDIYYPAP